MATIETKRQTRQWQEVTLSWDELIALFKNDWEDEGDPNKLSVYEYSPDLVFEEGTMFCDESWYFKNGYVHISSNASGIVEWSNYHEQYVHSFWGRETMFGQFQHAIIRVDKDLRRKIRPLLEKK